MDNTVSVDITIREEGGGGSATPASTTTGGLVQSAAIFTQPSASEISKLVQAQIDRNRLPAPSASSLEHPAPNATLQRLTDTGRHASDLGGTVPRISFNTESGAPTPFMWYMLQSQYSGYKSRASQQPDARSASPIIDLDNAAAGPPAPPATPRAGAAAPKPPTALESSGALDVPLSLLPLAKKVLLIEAALRATDFVYKVGASAYGNYMSYKSGDPNYNWTDTVENWKEDFWNSYAKKMPGIPIINTSKREAMRKAVGALTPIMSLGGVSGGAGMTAAGDDLQEWTNIFLDQSRHAARNERANQRISERNYAASFNETFANRRNR